MFIELLEHKLYNTFYFILFVATDSAKINYSLHPKFGTAKTNPMSDVGTK